MSFSGENFFEGFHKWTIVQWLLIVTITVVVILILTDMQSIKDAQDAAKVAQDAAKAVALAQGVQLTAILAHLNP